MTANYEYSSSDKENLPLPIQLQLSENPKSVCLFFIAFLESTFGTFWQKHETHSLSISDFIDSGRRAYLNHSHKKQIVWKVGPNGPFFALMLRTKLY